MLSNQLLRYANRDEFGVPPGEGLNPVAVVLILVSMVGPALLVLGRITAWVEELLGFLVEFWKRDRCSKADFESGGLDLELEGLGEVVLVKEVKRGRMYEKVEGVGGGGGAGSFGGGNH